MWSSESPGLGTWILRNAPATGILAFMDPSTLAALAADAWAARHACTPLRYEEPDRLNRRDPTVDLLGRDAEGLARLVLEHTLVESFLDERSTQIAASVLFGLLQRELTGHLPGPGHYNLVLKPAAVLGLKWEGARIRAWVEAWIRKTAPMLAVGGPQSAPGHSATVVVPNTALEVSLYRWPRNERELHLVFQAPAQSDDVLTPSLHRAIRTKCPKLAAAKATNPRAASLLLLEISDIALGNLFDLDAVVQAWLAGFPENVPDHIWLADTTDEPPSVMIAKEAGRVGDQLGERFLPFYLRGGTFKVNR